MLKIKNNKAFTIIELLVVVAIIAILAAVVSVNVMSYLSKARNAKRLVDIKNYANALEMAAAEDGSYPYGGTRYCYCLGDYLNDRCGFWDSCYESGVINGNLQRFIPGLPADDRVISKFWRGYEYTCSIDRRTITIEWRMEGENQSCGIGIGSIDYGPGGSFGGATFCIYTKSF